MFLPLPHGPELSLFFVFPAPPPHPIDTKLVPARVLFVVPLFFLLSLLPLCFVFDARDQESTLVPYHLRSTSTLLFFVFPFLLTRYTLISTRAYPIHAVRIQPNVIHGHPPTAIFLLIHTGRGRLPAFCPPAGGVG